MLNFVLLTNPVRFCSSNAIKGNRTQTLWKVPQGKLKQHKSPFQSKWDREREITSLRIECMDKLAQLNRSKINVLLRHAFAQRLIWHCTFINDMQPVASISIGFFFCKFVLSQKSSFSFTVHPIIWMKNRQLGEDKKGREINSFLHPPILSFILSRTIKCNIFSVSLYHAFRSEGSVPICFID